MIGKAYLYLLHLTRPTDQSWTEQHAQSLAAWLYGWAAAGQLPRPQPAGCTDCRPWTQGCAEQLFWNPPSRTRCSDAAGLRVPASCLPAFQSWLETPSGRDGLATVLPIFEQHFCVSLMDFMRPASEHFANHPSVFVYDHEQICSLVLQPWVVHRPDGVASTDNKLVGAGAESCADFMTGSWYALREGLAFAGAWKNHHEQGSSRQMLSQTCLEIVCAMQVHVLQMDETCHVDNERSSNAL